MKCFKSKFVVKTNFLDCTANNTLVEAIACGLPVVSNAVGGIRDYTRNTFAKLFSIGDIEGMSNAIQYCSDKPDNQVLGRGSE